MVNDLDYEGIKFRVSKKIIARLKEKKNICTNVFFYENGVTYPAYVSDQKFKWVLDLLLISDKNKSHYVYIKDFNRFIMCNKTNKQQKKVFASVVYHVSVVKKYWQNTKKLV